MCYKVFYAFFPLSHAYIILQRIPGVFRKMKLASGSAVATITATEQDLDLSPTFFPSKVLLASWLLIGP